MVKISFITFTRNSAKELDALLQHVADVVDEIIVVDGMSTDSTREVAESYGAKVFVRKPFGFVEPDRMFALSKASYDWILYLDTDERLSNKLKNDLKDLIETLGKEGYVAISTKRYEFLDGKPALFRKMIGYQIRIYNRKFVEYKGIIHELPIIKGPMIRLNAYEYFLIHLVKTKPLSKYLKKLAKYAYIEKIQIYQRERKLYRALVETKLAPIAYPLEIGLWLVLHTPANITGIRYAITRVLFYRTLVLILLTFRRKEEEKLAKLIQKHGFIKLLDKVSSKNEHFNKINIYQIKTKTQKSYIR